MGGEVTARHLVLVAAVVQGVFVAALLLLIIVNRWVRQRRRAAIQPRREAAEEQFRHWAAGDVDVDAVANALVPLPAPIAIERLAAWSSRVPMDRWPALAQALSHARWGAKLRRGARSRRWWRRLQSARFLAAAGVADDVPTLARLIKDPHPAVHLAAVSALNHVDSAELAEAAIDQLPSLPIHVPGCISRRRCAGDGRSRCPFSSGAWRALTIPPCPASPNTRRACRSRHSDPASRRWPNIPTRKSAPRRPAPSARSRTRTPKGRSWHS